MTKILFSPICIIACIIMTIAAHAPLSSLLTPYLTARYHAVRSGNGSISDDPPENKTSSHANQCVCSDIYDPVCATNNQSYFNTCLMDCAVSPYENISILHHGNCIPF